MGSFAFRHDELLETSFKSRACKENPAGGAKFWLRLGSAQTKRAASRPPLDRGELKNSEPFEERARDVALGKGAGDRDDALALELGPRGHFEGGRHIGARRDAAGNTFEL